MPGIQPAIIRCHCKCYTGAGDYRCRSHLHRKFIDLYNRDGYDRVCMDGEFGRSDYERRGYRQYYRELDRNGEPDGDSQLYQRGRMYGNHAG